MADLDTVLSRVAYIINKVPAARSNDLLLMLIYWQVFDEIPLPEQITKEMLEKATPPETITRRRRDLYKLRKQLGGKIFGEGNDKNKDQ